MKQPLTDKQAKFCAEYLVDLNATQAAIRAGYSAKTANVQAVEIMAKPHVQERIQSMMTKRAERTEITADYVLRTIVEVIERCKQAEAVRDKEGVETGEYKFDSGAVLKGTELLGKHLKLFTDKHEIEAKHTVTQMGRIVAETVDDNGNVINRTSLQFNVGSPVDHDKTVLEHGDDQ